MAAAMANACAEMGMSTGDILARNAIVRLRAGENAEAHNKWLDAATHYFFADSQFGAATEAYAREGNALARDRTLQQHVGVLRARVRVYTHISRAADDRAMHAQSQTSEFRERVVAALGNRSPTEVARMTPGELRALTAHLGQGAANVIAANVANYVRDMAETTALVEQSTSARVALRQAQIDLREKEDSMVMPPPAPSIA